MAKFGKYISQSKANINDLFEVRDDDGLVIGVRVARVNDRDVIIALRDTPKGFTFRGAVECNVPSVPEWVAIHQNLDKVNKVLVRYGGEKIGGYDYWTSSEYDSYQAWYFTPTAEWSIRLLIKPEGQKPHLGITNKSSAINVRCKM